MIDNYLVSANCNPQLLNDNSNPSVLKLIPDYFYTSLESFVLKVNPFAKSSDTLQLQSNMVEKSEFPTASLYMLLLLLVIFLLSEIIRKGHLINQYKLSLEKKTNELERKNKDLQHFLYKTTHDLRSPMVTLKGILNLVKIEIKPTSNTTEYFSKIDAILNKEDEMLKRLMEVSCLINGNIKSETINVGNLLNEIRNNYKAQLESENITFTIITPENLIIQSDKCLIEKALFNLINNSIKFKRRRDEGSFIKINAFAMNNGVNIELSDNGQGIPDGCHEKLFELFSRASAEKSGIGLGLYITRSSIEAVGGNIHTKSKFKEGSVFTIWLPNSNSVK